jgi:ketosteroid isomerase-like protein
MKICLIVALAGLAISLALPTFAQQTNTPDPQLRQRLLAVIEKHADAMNKNDAAAAAACFTEDAIYRMRAGNANYSGQAGIWDILEDGKREENDQKASSAL